MKLKWKVMCIAENLLIVTVIQNIAPLESGLYKYLSSMAWPNWAKLIYIGP